MNLRAHWSQREAEQHGLTQTNKDIEMEQKINDVKEWNTDAEEMMKTFKFIFPEE